ncbi:two-component sensor histidine kinase [Capsulimonas corticalis]|uniref:histidine kinase n=1 Tax=Capsulimonas corticalis TaxID=2219043 RepID=A0A402CW68_9BACT|nr:HAMP domain-containing sensor histidine kinase [Capsulimonas corticalis]BDI34054.1 two-component sensor histidine kinase [Capsulimonas corticalis]
MLLKTLHGRLTLILLVLLCLIGCLSVPLTLFTTQNYQQEVAQNLNRPLASSLAAHLTETNLFSHAPARLSKARSEIKYLMVINPDIDVYLLDTRGTILAYSGAPSDIRRDRVPLAPLQRFLTKSVRLPILNDDPRSSADRKVFSAAPIYASGQHPPNSPQGYVYVILGGQHYDSVAGLLRRSYILRSSLWGLGVLLASVSVAGLFLFRLLTQRLRRLTVAMETFRDLDFLEANSVQSTRLFAPWRGIVSPRDELDRLGTVCLQMSDRIQGQIQELALADTHRREMVSNASHDLRTPLAALQGYLETLLMKEGRMTPEEQRGYLQVAIRHSDRLAKLIGELFELAQLDAREVSLNSEAFSLSELVQDVVQQHQLTAEQKQIRLHASLPENLPFVRADIGLIERVLENLLENALRYTPEGGMVAVSLALEAESIGVRVTDTGCGISPADLAHIFERFYRAPGQSEKPGCAGLGLAIAKRILELHGSSITVESVLDQGTAFTFHLPIEKAQG